jgi:hypothetical protein
MLVLVFAWALFVRVVGIVILTEHRTTAGEPPLAGREASSEGPYPIASIMRLSRRARCSSPTGC